MTRPRPGQRVAFGEPPHDDRAYLGKILQPGDEQSLVKWDNGNETVALNTWLTPIEDEPTIIGSGGRQTIKPTSGTVEDKVRSATPKPTPKPKPKTTSDDLSERLKSYDAERLREFAIANGVWQDKYADLPNAGLVRMNVINRLRAKVKHGHRVIWK